MSLGLRVLPNKFSSFANTRKQVGKQLDRQLPKHVRSSPFLEEFLGTQVTAKTTRNVNTITVYSPCQNVPTGSLDTGNEFSDPLSDKICDWTQEQAVRSWQRPTCIRIPGILESREGDDLATHRVMANSIQKTDPLLSYNNFSKNNANESLNHNAEIPLATKILHDRLIPSNFQRHLSLFADPMIQTQETAKKEPSKETDSNKPTEEQLKNVYDVLSNDLPRFFVQSVDYRIYTMDIVFLNNIRGTVTTGLGAYVRQLALLRALGHFKYAYVQFEVIKMTMHPEDGTVKVRWRIKGITGMKVLLSFWKFKIWNIREAFHMQESWYDGFSTFYLNNEGKVFKHVADKIMPDEDVFVKEKPAIAAKLALFVALLGVDPLYWNELYSKTCSKLQLPHVK